jgi:hypothetical protein
MFNSMQAQWTLPTGSPVYNVLSVGVAAIFIFALHLVTCCTLFVRARTKEPRPRRLTSLPHVASRAGEPVYCRAAGKL